MRLQPLTGDGIRNMPDKKREFLFRDQDFRFISEMIQAKTGIVLNDQKKELTYGRLARRLRALSLTRFQDYCDLLQSSEGADEVAFTIDALTTNTTHFFREQHHFDFLAAKVLPTFQKNLNSASNKRFRIWSAGCSTGEEPYSIAMTLQETLKMPARTLDCKILATDIDRTVLDRAQSGRYPADAIEAIGARRASEFTSPVADDQGRLEMSRDLKAWLTFKRLNLLEKWPMRGPFDVIFCRNVMIYFDRDVQDKLIARFADMLAPGGILFIGHSESALAAEGLFDNLGQTTLRKVSPGTKGQGSAR